MASMVGRNSRGGRVARPSVVAVISVIAVAAVSLVAAVPPRNVCLAAGGGGSSGGIGGGVGDGGAAATSCEGAISASNGGSGVGDSVGGSNGGDGATLPNTARIFSATDFAGIYTARIPSVGACPTTIVHTSNGGPPPFAIPSTFSLPNSLTVGTELPTSTIPLPTVSTVYLGHETTAMDGSVCGPAGGGLLLTSSKLVPADQRELIFVAAASALEGQGRPLPDSVRKLKDQLSDFWVGVETSGRVCGGGAAGVFPAGTTVAFLQEERTVTAGLLRFASGFKYMVVVHNPTELTCVYRAELVDEVSTFAANPPATPTPLPTPSPSLSPSPTALPDVEEETADATGQAVDGTRDGEGSGGVGGGLLGSLVNSGEDSKEKLAESGILVVGSVLSTLLTAKEPSPSPTAVPVVAPSPVASDGGGGGGGGGRLEESPSSGPSETTTEAQIPATAGDGDTGEGRQPTSSGLFLDSTASESPACFPGDALVTDASGDTLRMADVGLSTVLATGPDTAPAAVYFFSHRVADTPATVYTRLQVAGGSMLELTPGHLLPLFGSGRLVSAATLTAGDELISANGTAARITWTARVVRTGAGLYNPHTAAGRLIVGGVLVSCYTTAVNVRVARVGLSVVRAAAAMGMAGRWRAVGLAEGGGWALHRLASALSTGA
ncbi:hypothetical protein MMPV_008317 [Pyropia vietnamensis]